MHRFLHLTVLLPAVPFLISAATLTVSQDGHTPFQTIQTAINSAHPGDTILVSPGVYHEHITIPASLRGTPDAPITLRTDTPSFAAGNVIITGASPAIRTGRTAWECVDANTQLYRTLHPDGWPARVLYDNIDLYPYATLDALNTFQNPNAPGPRHGYFYDKISKHLYLRLHSQYSKGKLNPADHLIAVAPSTGEGFEGTLITNPSHYGIGILGKSPAHIRIEGLTFETPGVAGIYTEADNVSISDNWFYGCRTAVSGNYQEILIDPVQGHAFKNLIHDPIILDRVASRVTLRRCFFTQYPTFEDVGDCITRLPPGLLQGRDGRLARYGAMWHRKSVGNGLPSELFKYEIGIACRIGRDWTIEDCAIINAFEGLSCHAVAGSENLMVRRNFFARLADNAIETEDWSRGMTITENLILDAFEPISWQPLRGLPWPTDIIIARNIIANTSDKADYWKPVFSGRGVFKIGVSLSNWRVLDSMTGIPRSPITLGGHGIEISHNLVYFPGGRLFTLLGDRNVPIREIRIHDNLLATDYLSDITRNPKNEMRDDHFTLTRNLAIPARSGAIGPGRIAAGPDGHVLNDLVTIGLPSADKLNFRMSMDSTTRASKSENELLKSILIQMPAAIVREAGNFDFSLQNLPNIPWPAPKKDRSPSQSSE